MLLVVFTEFGVFNSGVVPQTVVTKRSLANRLGAPLGPLGSGTRGGAGGGYPG